MELSKIIKEENKSLAASILNASKHISGSSPIKINSKENSLSENLNKELIFEKIEKKIRIQCIMNKENLLEDVDYTAYACSTCPDKIDVICQFCYLNCHKNHNLKNKGDSANVITVSLKNNPCKCALKDHEFENPNNNLKNSAGGNIPNIQNYCTLNEIFSELHPDFHYYEPDKKQYFCFFCVENCMMNTVEELEEQINGNSKNPSVNNNNFKEIYKNEKEIPHAKNLSELMKESKLTKIVTKDKLIKIPTINLKNSIVKCACKAIEFHEPYYENNNCLTYVFDLDIIKSSINISKLSSVIISDKNYEKIFDPVFKVVSSLFESNFNDNNYKTETNNFYESKVFLASIELLEAISDNYTKSYNPYLNHEGKFSIFKYFTFEYMIKIFENTDRIPHITYLKADMLKFFRNLTLKPLIKFKNMAFIDDFTNTSVLHRIILGRNFPLDDDLKDKFYHLTKLININLDKTCELLKDDEAFIYLLAEYIKLLLLILPFNDIFLDNNILKIDIDSNKEYANRSNNSINRNNKTESQNEISEEDYDFDYRINIFIDRITNYIGSVKKTGQAFKSFIKNWEKFCTKILILKNDYIFFRTALIKDHTLNMKYSFQESKFNENVFKLLFSFSTHSTEGLTNIKNKKFYDLILNNDDYYSNKIKSIIESDFNLFDKDILAIVDNNYSHPLFNHKDSYIVKFKKFTSNSLNEEKINIIENSIKDMELVINEYFSNTLNEIDFLQKCKNLLENLEKFIKKNILNLGNFDKNLKLSSETSEKFKFIIFRNQICLFKLNLFHYLVYMWITLIKIDYFKNNKDLLIIRDSVLVIIIRLLDCLTHENPFLSELFFNKFMVEIFLDFKEFYIKRFKTLKKYNYKANFEDYTKIFVENHKMIDIINDPNKASCILKIYFYILKFSSDKTLMVNNSLIYHELLEVLNHKEYNSKLEEIIDFFIDKSTENNNRGGNDYSLISNIVYPNNFIMIKNFMKSLSYLKPEYFYLVNDKLNSELIGKILGIDYSLDPGLRQAFTNVYYRYYCESYFTVKKDLDLSDLREIKEKTDFNLLTKVDLNESQINKSDSHPKNLLGPLIYNLEIFKLMIIYHDVNFKNKTSKIIKYFENIVTKPVIFMIYKIIYFAKNISAELKYIIYKVIYLFLECYKYFLDLIKSSDLNDIRRIVLLDAILFLPFENTSDIIRFINETYMKLEIDVKKINSDSFEQLNLSLLMKIFSFYLSNFNIYRQLTKKFESDDDSKAKEIIIRRKSNSDNPNNDLNLNYEKENSNNNRPDKKFEKSEITGINTSNNLNENLIQHSKDDLLNSLNGRSTIKIKNLSFKLDNNNNLNLNTYSNFKNDIKYFIIDYEFNKNNFFSDNILKKIFSEEQNDILSIPNYKQIIALDLFSKLDFKQIQGLNPINEENEFLLEAINKVFKVDPHHWQDIIIEKIHDSKNLISNIIEKQLPFLLQCILIEFNKLDTNRNSTYYYTFLNMIEFFRLLCEDHNKIFQTLLINFKINDLNDDFYHFNFILKIPPISLQYLKYFLEKKEIISFFKDSNSDFFDQIVNKLTDYNIELIQGCLSKNFDQISSMKEFSEYYESHYKFFDFLEGNKLYENILSNFIKFINCFIEENSNKLDNKIELIKKLNPKKLYSILLNCFIELFKYLEDIKESKNNFSIKNYADTLKEKFLDAYYINKYELSELPYFNISFGIFKYFKRVSLYKGHGEKIFKVLETFKKSNPNILNLFNTIIKDVEIVFKLENTIELDYLLKFKEFFEKPSLVKLFQELEKSHNDKDKFLLDKVIFLIHPNTIFHKTSDVYDFIEKAPSDNFNTKLNFLLEYFPELNRNIEVRKNLKNLDNKVLYYLYSINYNNLEGVSAFISLLTCLLLLFNLQYDDKMNMIFSAKTFVYTIAILHNMFLLFFIINWLGFNIFKNWICRVPDCSIISFINNNLNIIINEDIFILLWNFIFGVLALFNEKLNFLFALQLFSIFKIFPTMSSVIYSVRIRYKQFASTGFLLIILILFYTSITYFFFRDDLYREDLKENICGSYFQCFLFLINSGIRSGSGIEFGLKGISEVGYYKEFLFGWMFYFIIMLIIVNIINGIIVDTFQALREQNNKKDDILNNFCYICSLERSEFEIKGINYEFHLMNDHSISNYLDYLIKIQGTDEHELNSLDSQVLKAIKEFKTDFFPNKKAKSLENV